MPNSVAFMNPNNLLKVVENEASYRKQPLLFLVFSYTKNKTLYEMLKNLTLTRIENKGSWTLIKFTKLNKQEHD